VSTRLNFCFQTSKCNFLIFNGLIFLAKDNCFFSTWQHCHITTTLSYFLVPCPRRLALWEKMKNLVPLCHWLNWYWLLAPCPWQLALTGYWLKEFASGFFATGYWLWHLLLAPCPLAKNSWLLAPLGSQVTRNTQPVPSLFFFILFFVFFCVFLIIFCWKTTWSETPGWIGLMWFNVQ